MKSFTKLFVFLALSVAASFSMATTLLLATSMAASETPHRTENEAANTMGIITPDMATTVVVFDYFTRFPGTGDFAICSDGTDSSQCGPKTYLTPEQFVAKFYPKAKYVGFRLLLAGSNGNDTYLHLYLKKKPQ